MRRMFLTVLISALTYIAGYLFGMITGSIFNKVLA
jgi:hypothetical protein